MGSKTKAKQNSLTLMCISDKGPVRRFTLRPAVVRLAVLMLALLFLGCAATGYLWYTSLQNTKMLENRIAALEQELETGRAKLVRLQNMERMTTTYDRGEVKALLGESRGEAVRGQVPDVDLNTILSPVDLQIVGVKNVQAGLENRVLDVSFEINNLDTGKKVTGRFLYALVTSSGEVIELMGEDQGREFEIRYFNRIESDFDLPEDVTADAIYGLKLVIEDDAGVTLYRDTFAFSRILI